MFSDNFILSIKVFWETAEAVLVQNLETRLCNIVNRMFWTLF